MIALFPNKFILVFLFIGICLYDGHAQEYNLSMEQDPKFEQLLNEKRKINASLAVNDSYKIQVFSGSSDNAKKALNEFRQEFKDVDATIVFNTPNYKVWVGNFRTRIEVEKTLVDVIDRYKNALLIKPSK